MVRHTSALAVSSAKFPRDFAQPLAQPTSARSSTAKEPQTPRALFDRYRLRIIVCYLLLNVENVLRLLQPLVLGLAINDLLHSSYFGLSLLIGQHLLHLAVGTLRQMYDTRVFAGIQADLAAEQIAERQAPPRDISPKDPRLEQRADFAELYERHLPQAIRVGWSVAGALLFLLWYDYWLLPVCLAMVIPVALLNAAHGHRTSVRGAALPGSLESDAGVIDRTETTAANSHYQELARRRIGLSDAEALNFGLMELFGLGLIVVSLVHYCSVSGVQAGDIFAVFRYLMIFVVGLREAPGVVRQLGRWKSRNARSRCRRV